MSGIISTVAGSGSSGKFSGAFSGDGGPATDALLDSPAGLSVDGFGNLYIADYANNRVRKMDGETGVITTVAGSGPTGFGAGAFSGDGGPATEARLDSPSDAFIDGASNLYISDQYNNRVRK